MTNAPPLSMSRESKTHFQTEKKKGPTYQFDRENTFIESIPCFYQENKQSTQNPYDEMQTWELLMLAEELGII